MTPQQRTLLDKLALLVKDAMDAGFDNTLAFDLNEVQYHYERYWKADK